MRLFEIMSARVETIDPSDEAERAWGRLQTAGVHHLVVIRARRLVGVISDLDLGGPNGPAVRYGRQVSDLMSHKIVTARPDTTLREAANLLRGHEIGCLPVLDGTKLVGIVTTTDLLDLIGRGFEHPIRAPKRSTNRKQRRTLRSAA